MTPERVKDVVQKHFIGGEPVIDYTFYEAPHPSEGFVYQISLSDYHSDIEIVWQEPEEQL